MHSSSFYHIRPIERQDNAAVAAIIREVMPEFGANGPGFAINDPEVDDMHGTYTQPRSAYFVVIINERVIGGGGIAPLKDGAEDTCELRKMYFLPAARGLGMGQKILDLCLNAARSFGYRRCYLETLKSMNKAQALYHKNGFKMLCAPLGNTGHFSCDTWFEKDL